VIVAAFAFLGGVSALLAMPAMPHPPLVGPIVLTVPLALILRRNAATRALACACCGFLFAAAQAGQHLQQTWPEARTDERVFADVVVATIPLARGEGSSFDASIRITSPATLKRALRARLISRDAAVQPQVGERWHLLLALRPPRAALNPGAVDFERLLFHERIHATGTVLPSRLNQRMDVGHYPIDALRERIAARIGQEVVDRDAAALIAALAVGVTGAMSHEQWRVFSATGTTHLVAISGMHVTMFALVMFAIARWLWRAWAWRYTSWGRENFAAVCGLSAAAGYAVLAGLSVPTQRTLIMLAAWLLARSMARASPPLQPLAIALIGVLLLDPFAPLAAGFWLSFGAMGAILFVTQTRVTRRSALHEAVVVQLAVASALVPLTLACFGCMSVIGPLVNAAAIPYVSWLMVPVILAALVLLPFWPAASDLTLKLAEWLHNLAWPWLAKAADSPLALAYASPPPWWYALAAAAVAIALLPWPGRLRLAAVVCVLPLIWADRATPLQGGIELTALDAGDGTAIVIQTAAHVLVYGTGEAYGTAGNRAENIVVPFLRSRGVRTVDALVVDRLTPVSGAGVTALFAALPVTQTIVGGLAAADFSGARACKPGESWSWDGVRFRVLDACALAIEASGAGVRISRASVQLAGARIVPGRSERNGKEKAAVAAWRRTGERVLATGDVGAVSVTIDARDGVTDPEGLRSRRRALWRGGPV
jgi:competence protein ComEC